MSKLPGAVSNFNGLTTPKKTAVIVGLLAVEGCLIYVSAYVIGTFMNVMQQMPAKEEIDNVALYAILNNTKLVLVFAGLMTLLGLIFALKSNFVNTPKHYDEERGIWIMDSDTMGGQRYLTNKELEYEFKVGDISNIDAPIFGQISEKGKKVIGWKKRVDGPSGNQNVLCIAPMGTGKSFGPVRVNLLQAIKRGESFVVTDPKMEIYNSLAQYCEDQGMNVHVLNLAEPKYSEFWNVFEETIDPDTERIDSTRLNDFSAIYMANSGNGQQDGFWEQTALNLMSAVIGFVAFEHESEIIENYIDLYKVISGVSKDDNITMMHDTMLGFPECREIIRQKALEKGYDVLAMNDLERQMADFKKYTKHQFNLETIYFTLLNFNDIEPRFAGIPDWHAAKAPYLTFKTNATESVRSSAIQGTQLRFQIFSDKKLRDALSYDGIHCSDVTKTHSAYFVILSDKTETTKPVASLFFSFLFKDVMDAWDKELSIAEAKGEKNPRLPLTLMLDEFYSIGVIGGSPKAFGTTMATSRSREIHIWIILQSYSQLAALYGPETGNMIQGGCSIILYLGGNDPATTEFISSFVAGDSTVLTESHADVGGVLGNKSTNPNLSVTKRSFITSEEAKRWRDKVLIAKQATYLAKANPFPWIDHPAYKFCRKTSVYTNLLPIENRVSSILTEKNSVSNPEVYMHKQIIEFGKRHNGNTAIISDEDLPEIIFDDDTGEVISDENPSIDFTLKETSDPAQKQNQGLRRKNIADPMQKRNKMQFSVARKNKRNNSF